MSRTRALSGPWIAAWAAALAAAAAVIAVSLSLGRARFLAYGFAAVMGAGGLTLLGLRRGTGGWLAAGMLLLVGLLPQRILLLWQPEILGGVFGLVIVSILVTAGLAWLGRLFTQRSGRTNGLALPQVLLLAVAAAGMLLRSGEYFSPGAPMQALAWIFLPMLGFWIVASSRLERRDVLALTRVLLAVGVVMALLGLRWPLQLWRGGSAGLLFGSVAGRAVRTITPIGGPGLSAMILAMMVPVAVAMAMEDTRWWRRIWIACSLLLVAAIAFSVSRTGIVAGIGALALFGWLNRRLLRRHLLAVVMTIVVSAGLVTVSVVHYRQYTNFARVTRFLDPDNPSDRLRMTSARGALEVGSKRPILGSGIGQSYLREAGATLLVEGMPSAADPHSLYLLAFAEMGVPGLLLVLWLIARPMWDFLRERRRADPGRAVVLSAFACSALALAAYSILSCALFVHLRVASVAWWTLGLGYQFVKGGDERTSE